MFIQLRESFPLSILVTLSLTFSVKFWDVRAKQTEFYLEAFSRRSKTVFKNTNCPEAVIIPQATRGSKVK